MQLHSGAKISDIRTEDAKTGALEFESTPPLPPPPRQPPFRALLKTGGGISFRRLHENSGVSLTEESSYLGHGAHRTGSRRSRQPLSRRSPRSLALTFFHRSKLRTLSSGEAGPRRGLPVKKEAPYVALDSDDSLVFPEDQRSCGGPRSSDLSQIGVSGAELGQATEGRDSGWARTRLGPDRGRCEIRVATLNKTKSSSSAALKPQDLQTQCVRTQVSIPHAGRFAKAEVIPTGKKEAQQREAAAPVAPAAAAAARSFFSFYFYYFFFFFRSLLQLRLARCFAASCCFPSACSDGAKAARNLFASWHWQVLALPILASASFLCLGPTAQAALRISSAPGDRRKIFIFPQTRR